MTSITSHRRIIILAMLMALAVLALSLSLANLVGDSPAHAATHAIAHSGAVNTEDGSPAAASDTLDKVKAEIACLEAHGMTFTEQPEEVTPGFVTIPIGHYNMLPGEDPSAAAARGSEINQQCYLSTHSS